MATWPLQMQLTIIMTQNDSLREKLLEYGQMRQANIGATALALRNSPRYQEILRARRKRLRNWNYYGRFY